MSKQKPSGFWKNWENYEGEMLNVIKKLGHFPSRRELKKLGRSTLGSTACQYYDGLISVRVRMGFEKPHYKEPNYWKNWENVDNSIKSEIGRLGHFPSCSELEESGLGGMCRAIFSYFDGLNGVRKTMGYDTVFDKKYSTKNGLQIGLEELWKLYQEQRGKIPPDNWMRENGFQNLGVSIVKYHGGFRKVRERFGFEEMQRYRGKKLDTWGKLKGFIDLLFSENPEFGDILPSDTWMKNNGHYGLGIAIRKYHGGLRKVRDKLGQKQLKEEDGLLKDFDFVINKLEIIVNENPELNGKLPTVNWLQENGYSGLYTSIHRHHGGYTVIREKLGEELDLKKPGYWADWNNVIIELDDAIELNSGVFPSRDKFSKLGLSSLYYAIQRYHGGIVAVRERIGFVDNSNVRLEGLLVGYVSGGRKR